MDRTFPYPWTIDRSRLGYWVRDAKGVLLAYVPGPGKRRRKEDCNRHFATPPPPRRQGTDHHSGEPRDGTAAGRAVRDRPH